MATRTEAAVNTMQNALNYTVELFERKRIRQATEHTEHLFW